MTFHQEDELSASCIVVFFLLQPVYVGFFTVFNQRLKYSDDVLPPFYHYHLLKQQFTNTMSKNHRSSHTVYDTKVVRDKQKGLWAKILLLL